MEKIKIDKGSFRDPSGYVFYKGPFIYRSISFSYKEHFDYFIESGLYNKLLESNLIVSHKEINKESFEFEGSYKIIQPEKIRQISYPYEWSFSQLKDAALLTLKIQKIAIEFGMTLKDATGFNVQFQSSKPIFIDTLSFEKIDNDFSWVAYKQFLEMFLNPLILFRYVDENLSSKILKSSINGIDSVTLNKLLALKYKLKPSIFFHVVLPSILNNKVKSQQPRKKKSAISKKQHLNIIEQLYSFISKLNLKSSNTQWGQYYNDVNQEKDKYLIDKKAFITNTIESLDDLNVVWDLGSNDGYFSRLFNTKSFVISMDFDWKSVESNYLQIKKATKHNILPLCIDLINPSPGVGWMNNERSSIFNRLAKPDLIMGLALVHHLLNFNIPLTKIVDLFDNTAKYLIIEYVPFSDPKSREIFYSRRYEFVYPTLEVFNKVFEKNFNLVRKKKLEQTNRVILFYVRKNTEKI